MVRSTKTRAVIGPLTKKGSGLREDQNRTLYRKRNFLFCVSCNRKSEEVRRLTWRPGVERFGGVSAGLLGGGLRRERGRSQSVSGLPVPASRDSAEEVVEVEVEVEVVVVEV